MKNSILSLISKIVSRFKKKLAAENESFSEKHLPLLLTRLSKNPILKPIFENSWESKAVFNPAVIFEAGKIHFIYRAVGEDDVSVFGYASSLDGVKIEERLKTPVYTPSGPLKKSLSLYVSGPGFGGCEDPRITKVGNRFYMTYTDFNGYEPPRVALTSIAIKDFLKKSWNWRYPVVISPPGEIHKNWVIFPEKIKGKYAVLHSISPKILVDYLDTLEFDDKGYIESYHGCDDRTDCWDSQVRGVGPPPIKTKDGWLIFYHAMDNNDPGRYKVGAMLLDLNDPTKVFYRSVKPILEPSAKYENEGLKAGVVYVCGVAVLGERLMVYYGGADSVICGATSNLKEFLSSLKNSQPTPLQLTTEERLR